MVRQILGMLTTYATEPCKVKININLQEIISEDHQPKLDFPIYSEEEITNHYKGVFKLNRNPIFCAQKRV